MEKVEMKKLAAEVARFIRPEVGAHRLLVSCKDVMTTAFYKNLKLLD